MSSQEDPLAQDLANVVEDILVALATNRQPEDVQRERHERELAEMQAVTRRKYWSRRFTR